MDNASATTFKAPEAGPSKAQEQSARLLPIDGLRAFSIALVLFGHSTNRLEVTPYVPVWLWTGLPNAEFGVSTFFVVSGFVITRLLLRELDRSGSISLKRFYARRAFRILPALLVFLGGLYIAGAVGFLSISLGEMFRVVPTFLFNYGFIFPRPLGTDAIWFLGHTWSLCIEEQFYLVWPLVLVVLGPKWAFRVAIAVLLLSPAVRVATYFGQPTIRGYIPVMTHTRIDTIMVGCLAALRVRGSRLDRIVQHAFRGRLQWFGVFYLLFLSAPLEARYRGSFMLPIGYSLQAIFVGLFLLWLVDFPKTRVAGALSSRVVVHLGLISYSLYLWQQLVTSPLPDRAIAPFPLNVLLAVLLAELSYRLVERPFLSLGRRLLGYRLAVPTRQKTSLPLHP